MKKPLFYTWIWLKAATQVIRQRMLMFWLFYFNPPPLQLKEINLKEGD